MISFLLCILIERPVLKGYEILMTSQSKCIYRCFSLGNNLRKPSILATVTSKPREDDSITTNQVTDIHNRVP